MSGDQLTMSHPVGGAFPSIHITSAGSNKRLFIVPVSYNPVYGIFGPSLTSVWLQIYHARERRLYSGDQPGGT